MQSVFFYKHPKQHDAAFDVLSGICCCRRFSIAFIL